MPTLSVQNMPAAVAVPVPAGATLLAALQAAGHDWMHACGAKGRCTTCRLLVTEGLEALTPPTGPELRYLAAGRLLPQERLTCQARWAGSAEAGTVAGRVPVATQLPHQQYSV